MARVLTLDGLKTTKLGRRFYTCPKTEVVYSPTLDEEIEVCLAPGRRRRRTGSEIAGKKRKAGKTMKKGSCVMKKKRCMCRDRKGRVKFAKKSRCKK